MKVQYFGDVNDYRKYALLRLLGETGLRLGINWMLTPDDGRDDGNKRHYLKRPGDWRGYDADLFDILGDIPEHPSLYDFGRMEREGLIPGATYFEQMVPVGAAAREHFQAQGMNTFAICDLVFFDPDNGLATKSTSKSRRDGIKFVFDDELAEHWSAGRSLAIYQHFPHVDRAQFVLALADRVRGFCLNANIWACHTSHVVFLIAANPSDHAAAITKAIAQGRAKWPASFMTFQDLSIE